MKRSLYQMGLSDGVGADEQSMADGLIAQVKGNYKRWVVANPIGLTDSPQERSVKGAVTRLGNAIDKWTGKLYDQAVAGKKDDGNPYSWADWADMGHTINDMLKSMGADAIDTTRLNTLQQTASKSVDQVEALAKKVAAELPSGDTLKSGLIVLGVLAGGVVVYKLVK